MHEEGYSYFVDRKEDIIERDGENVSAGKVEAVLKQDPAVSDAAVIDVPEPIRDEVIEALVILREGRRASAEDRVVPLEALQAQKVPEMVEFTDVPAHVRRDD